jgi:hypothetical protein
MLERKRGNSGGKSLRPKLTRAGLFALLLAAAVGGQENSLQQKSQSAAGKSGPLSIVEGTVRDHITGLAIADAAVWTSNQKRTTTDATGHYIVKDLSSGTNVVYSAKPGYSKFGSSSERIIHLLAGDHLAPVDLELYPDASISGRVLDATKTPLAGVRVAVWAKVFWDGHPAFAQRGSAISDQNGDYAVRGLRGGQYFLATYPQLSKPQPRIDDLSGGKSERPPQFTEVRQFYPNATTIDAASPFWLRESDRREAMDLVLEKAPTFCVTAAATIGEGIAAGARLSLVVDETGGWWWRSIAQGSVKPDEPYEVCGLPPGAYNITAWASGENGAFSGVGRTEFSIAKRDVALSPIAVSTWQSLTGKVVIPDAKPEDQVNSKIAVVLNPSGRYRFAGEKTEVRVAIPGEFRLPTVLPTEYWLRVLALPSGYYVRDAAYAFRNALREPIVPGNSELLIVLAMDGPSLEGNVTTEDNLPIHDAQVVLVPKDWVTTSNPDLIRIANTDQNGAFSFPSGLTPGDYRIIAFRDLREDQEGNPDFIAGYLSHSTEITLAPRDKKQISINALVPR